MRCLCKYSGTVFEVPNFARTSTQSYYHPVFSLPLEDLLRLSKDFFHNRLNKTESRILFAALLKYTDLVKDWDCPIDPTDTIVAQNMEAMLATVTWIDTVTAYQKRHIVFPRYAITHYSRSLSNIAHYLDQVADARKAWENGYRDRDILENLKRKEEALEKLIKSPARDVETYAKNLAAWAMVAGNVPIHLHETWTKIFTLRGLGILGAETEEIELLLEHMELSLPEYNNTRNGFGSIQTHAVLGHLRNILRKNRGSTMFTIDDTPFTIEERTTEMLNKEAIAATAPAKRPEKKDYASLVEYIRAKIAFEMREKLQAKAEQNAQERLAQMEASLLNNLELEIPEVDEDDSVADPNQLDFTFLSTSAAKSTKEQE